MLRRARDRRASTWRWWTGGPDAAQRARSTRRSGRDRAPRTLLSTRTDKPREARHPLRDRARSCRGPPCCGCGWRPGAPTRSARTSPRSGIRCAATPATGAARAARRLGSERQFLHAHSLCLVIPITGKQSLASPNYPLTCVAHSTQPGGSQSPEGQTGTELVERGGLRGRLVSLSGPCHARTRAGAARYLAMRRSPSHYLRWPARSGHERGGRRPPVVRPLRGLAPAWPLYPPSHQSNPAGSGAALPGRHDPGPRTGRREHTTTTREHQMAEVSIKELLEAGVHFGHQTRRWNPKMRRYIFGERGGIHIIDLQQTEQLLAEAQEFAGERRRPRRHASCSSAPRSRPATRSRRPPTAAGMPYINQRWLGGLLTNFQTISKRIKRLHELTRVDRERHDRPAADARAHRGDERARQARDQPRRRARHAAPARRDVRRRPQDRGDRRARGRSA